MHYEPNDLEKLWALIKNTHCIFWGKYLGLKEVKFDLSLEKFTKNYMQKCHKFSFTQKTIVATNIDQVINELEGKEILSHHLSCAAKTRNINSALCIHYSFPKEKEQMCIAIPGVNYIADKKTSKELKKIYSK